MSAHQHQAFRQAFALTLDALIVRLREAQGYLDAGQDLAAVGTLVSLDDEYADLEAALRLFRNNRRKS